MTLRCKPGDIAIVINSSFPENLGRFVTCVRILFEDVWEISFDERHPMMCKSFLTGDIKSTNEMKGRFAIEDASLYPIRGDTHSLTKETENTLQTV